MRGLSPNGLLNAYLLYIPQALSVKQNKGAVWLLRMRHTPHPDSLGVRLHPGAQREACRGSGDKREWNFNGRWAWKLR